MSEIEHSLDIGTVLHDKWVILEFLAKGGMGEVYRAHQYNLKRDEAIKIISKEWLELCEQEEEFRFALQRFRHEVQAMAQVRHPNILQIYDYGSCEVPKGEGRISVEYLAMEFIPGGSLWSTMSEEGFYPEEELTKEWVSNYFVPVLAGVQALHDSNIIHRDLKPGNVLMDGKIPKIADFGLARSCKMQPTTRSADIQGTPQYMPSEQFVDLRRTDNRADIYSLGKILCEAISGKMGPKTIPFKRASLKNPQTSFFKGMDRIIQRATAENREERFESTAGFRSELLKTIDHAGTKGKPGFISGPIKSFPPFLHQRWTFLAILSGLLVIGLAWLYWYRPIGSWELAPTTREAGEPDRVLFRAKPTPSTLPSRVEAPDDVTLFLVPGGEVALTEGPGSGSQKTIKVNSFYMDETQVTNH